MRRTVYFLAMSMAVMAAVAATPGRPAVDAYSGASMPAAMKPGEPKLDEVVSLLESQTRKIEQAKPEKAKKQIEKSKKEVRKYFEKRSTTIDEWKKTLSAADLSALNEAYGRFSAACGNQK